MLLNFLFLMQSYTLWPVGMIKVITVILFRERRIIFIGLETVYIYCISSSEWCTRFFKPIRMSVRKKACHWSLQKLYSTHPSGIQLFYPTNGLLLWYTAF